jgi:hypothetical protein
MALQAEYTEVADEIIKKTLRVSDQRLYLRSLPSLTTSVVAKAAGSATDTKPPAGKEVPKPPAETDTKPPAGKEGTDGRTTPPRMQVLTTAPRPPLSGIDGRTTPTPQEQAVATVNALSMIDQLMAPSSEDHANLTNFFCRTKSKTVR